MLASGVSAEVSAVDRRLQSTHLEIETAIAVLGGLILLVVDAWGLSLIPLVANLEKAYSLSPSEASWALSVAGVVAAGCVPTVARLGDRLGMRRLVLASLALGLAGNVICAVAPGFGLLLFGRAILGGSAAIPLVYAILRARGTSAARVTRGVGILSAAAGVGVAVSYLLSDHRGQRVGLVVLGDAGSSHRGHRGPRTVDVLRDQEVLSADQHPADHQPDRGAVLPGDRAAGHPGDLRKPCAGHLPGIAHDYGLRARPDGPAGLTSALHDFGRPAGRRTRLPPGDYPPRAEAGDGCRLYRHHGELHLPRFQSQRHLAIHRLGRRLGVCLRLRLHGPNAAFLHDATPAEAAMYSSANTVIASAVGGVGPAIFTAVLTSRFIPHTPIPDPVVFKYMWIYAAIGSAVMTALALLVRRPQFVAGESAATAATEGKERI